MSEPVPTPTALRVRAGEQILGRRGQAFAVIDGGGAPDRPRDRGRRRADPDALMTDLAAWLLEQFAEDEAVARAATSLGYGWDADGLAGDVYASGGDPQTGTLVAEAGEHADAAHIARWDPARVLAECEVKRRIVNAWLLAESYMGSEANDGMFYGLDKAVHLLAPPYADRPGYDEAWRP